MIEPVVGPARPFILISWHYLNGAFCFLRNEIIGPIVGHHLGLGLLILDHFLVQMGLVANTPSHLECHSEYAQPCEGVGSQVMDL